MSDGWSIYIIVITVANILACLWLIRWTTKKRPGESVQGDVTGHTWDDNLQEYNNPLPRWWLWMFYITIVFSAIYLVFYPGLGLYKGTFGWSQVGQYEEEMDLADQNYAPIFAAYAKTPMADLIKDHEAMASGQRIFLNNCATCHGSDAGGAIGFPNLADNDWLYGGEPGAIKTSILSGRQGVMPAMGAGLPVEQLDQLVAYGMRLSGREVDTRLVDAGRTQYQAMCVGCHGADGKGNAQAGFPNLTDNIWLYGGTPGAIKQSIKQGRNGIMPAHRDILGEEKAHLLAAYVYSLSQ